MAKKSKGKVGSSLETFLKKNGIYKKVTASAEKRVLAWQGQNGMKRPKIAKIKTVKRMHRPSHPGLAIRRDCLEAVGLTVTEAAKWLGVSRRKLNSVLSGHTEISPDLAVRLEKGGWSTAETWIHLQYQYNLWETRNRAPKIKVKRFK